MVSGGGGPDGFVASASLRLAFFDQFRIPETSSLPSRSNLTIPLLWDAPSTTTWRPAAPRPASVARLRNADASATRRPGALSVSPLNTATSALFRATVQLRPTSGWHRSGRPCSHPAGRTGAVHRPARVAGPGRQRRFVRYTAVAGVSVPARWKRPRRPFRGGGGGRHGLRRQGDIGAQPPAGERCAWTPPQGCRC